MHAANSHCVGGGISLLVVVSHAAGFVPQPVGLQELQHPGSAERQSDDCSVLGRAKATKRVMF